jgi:heptosyltransferase-1
MRILIIKLSSLGDIVHALPVLYFLKQAYPQAEIDWVTEEVGGSLLAGHPYLKRLLIYKRYGWPQNLRKGKWLELLNELKQFKRSLQEEHYELVLDLQGLFKSGFIAWLSKGREKVGFANGREGSYLFLNKKYKANYDEHAVIRYLKLLAFAGIPVNFAQISFPLISAPLPFSLDSPYVVINPVARWSSKMWFKEKWIALATALIKMGYRVVFTGAKGDKDYIDTICQKVPLALNLAGKTSLKQLVSLYCQAYLTISVDTGTMHLAAAAGSPVIALFGPTAPWRTGPFGQGHRVIFKKLPCQPCFQRKCTSRRCLAEIEVEEVIEAVKTHHIGGRQ